MFADITLVTDTTYAIFATASTVAVSIAVFVVGRRIILRLVK